MANTQTGKAEEKSARLDRLVKIELDEVVETNLAASAKVR